MTHGEDFDTKLNALEDRLVDLRQQKAKVDGGIAYYRQCQPQLKDNRCCPLCERGFKSNADLKQLIDKVSYRLSETKIM